MRSTYTIRVFLLLALVVLAAGCGGSGGGESTAPDFAVELVQDPLLLVIGTVTRHQVDVVPIGGFADDVELSLVGVPAAIQVTLDPTWIAGGQGSSVLEVNVPTGTTPGDYPFTLRATTSDTFKDTPITVTAVLLPPDRFSVALDLATVAIQPGHQDTVSVDVTQVGSFVEAVDLSVVTPPAGVTATFVPATVPGGAGTTELRLEVAAATTPGCYPLTVRGQGGGYSEDLPLTLLVPPPTTSSGLTLSLPPFAAVRSGTSTAVGLHLARQTGVTGDVALQVTGAPTGLVAGFSATPCATADTLLTLQATAALAPGWHPIALQGTVGLYSGTAGLLLYVSESQETADAWISRVELAQTYLGPDVRLVPQKPVLVRAHVLADQVSLTSPRVLLTAYRGIAVLGTLALAGPATLPVAEEASTLALSFTGDLPAAWVDDGLKLRLDLDPDDVLVERNEQNNALRFTPAVSGPTRLNLVIVPLILDGRTGTPPDLHDTLYHHWPLSQVNISVRAAYQVTSVPKVLSNGDGWSSVLSEVSALRQSDGSNATYYGVIKTDYGSGVAGMAYIGYPVAIGMDNHLDVASHELGHTFGLRHAPCGGATGTDPAYPYSGGILGSWGYNLGSGQLYPPPSYRDMMSYCYPKWISDYNYAKVHARMEPVATMVGTPGPDRPALLVSGRIAAGSVQLDPLQSVVRPVPVHTSGTHWLILEGPAGRAVYPFHTVEVARAPGATGDERHFALTVANPGLIDRVAIEHHGRILLDQHARARATATPPSNSPDLELARVGEQLEVRWNAAVFPRATVTHVGSRRTTLGLWLSGGHAMLPLCGIEAGGTFEVNLTDGLNGQRRIVADR